MVENLNHLAAGNAFFNVSVDRADSCLLSRVVFAALFGDKSAGEKEHRNKCHGNKGQPDVCGYHKYKGSDKGDCAADEGYKGVVEHGVDVVDVVGVAAHNLTGGVAVKISYRQRLHLGEQVVSYAFHRVLTYGKHKPRLKICAQYGNDVNRPEKCKC